MTGPADVAGIDFLLDLSRWRPGGAAVLELLEELRSSEALGDRGVVGTILLASEGAASQEIDLPERWRCLHRPEPIVAADRTLELASREGRSFLVITEPVVPGGELVGALEAALEEDPLFGAAVPRQRAADGGILPLAAGDDGDSRAGLPRRLLAEIPRRYIFPELVAACILLRRELVGNLTGLDRRFRSLRGAWLQYLCRARRLGFRSVVANDAVLDVSRPGGGADRCDEHQDYWTLHWMYADVALGRKELESAAALRHEELLGRALRPQPAERRRLLIDARGLQQRHNGTTAAALGILKGLRDLDCEWHTTVLADRGAAEFHRLAELCASWRVLHEEPSTRFAAAVRLSQPWDFDTMIGLHRTALFNFYLMLDTISWDVLYVGSWTHTLGATWRFLAEHADGLLFDSEFTRNRFARRFQMAPAVGQHVCRLSCHPRDYATPAGEAADGSLPFLFVVGNQLDHKFVPQTVALLATAFPYLQIRALGGEDRESGNVTIMQSGVLPPGELESCYAQARVLVFPSFYEGFGFPVLQGLSHGRAVVARRSDLVEEIAGHYSGPGSLYTYETPLELVEIVGGLLHGAGASARAIGTRLDGRGEPASWKEVATGLVEFVEQATAAPNRTHWLSREHKIEQLAAYHEQHR